MDAAGLEDRRRRLLANARGEVVEVGGGTGLNLPHYRDVDRVVVLEPDGAMRRRLLERIPSASVAVEVHEAGIEECGLPDAFADTVVCSLVLCTVPDLDAALAAIRGLLKPDGVLLFMEHVRALGLQGRVQQLVTPVWRHIAGGCHLDRDTPAAIRGAGLVITDSERFSAGGTPMISGLARHARVVERSELGRYGGFSPKAVPG